MGFSLGLKKTRRGEDSDRDGRDHWTPVTPMPFNLVHPGYGDSLGFPSVYEDHHGTVTARDYLDDLVAAVDQSGDDGRTALSDPTTSLSKEVDLTRSRVTSRAVLHTTTAAKKNVPRTTISQQQLAISSSRRFVGKVDHYSNSKLPLDLKPLKLYLSTYRLLSLAAQYAERVYEERPPQEADRRFHIKADWRSGARAMVIKPVPIEGKETIVLAIRGTASFADWAVNLDTAPTSPAGFLDDQGNLCHAGFLSTARKMIAPIAAHLQQQLLVAHPQASNKKKTSSSSSPSPSLLITGHSAGGAIASLLYSHMLSTTAPAASELTALTSCFKRVHCITFGSPPVSLLPLTKPADRALKKSLFLSFVNEGDPVARADKGYVRSLVQLFLTNPSPIPIIAAPEVVPPGGATTNRRGKRGSTKLHSTISTVSIANDRPAKYPKQQAAEGMISTGPVWPVPVCPLSNAGRLIVLRSGNMKAKKTKKKKEGRTTTGAVASVKRTVEDRLNEGVIAQITTDEQLREVIWGDPVCHYMSLYAGRIETLAIGAMTLRRS